MWNIVCLCKVLVLGVFTLNTLAFRITKPLSREQIYIDVLKNITHVHKILNDLLRNYKHLKEIYEAQAKPHNELSDEIEVDDENGQKRNKTDSHYDSEFHPVTQMILLDDGVLDESSDKSKEIMNIKENLQPQFSDNIKIDFSDEKKSVGKGETEDDIIDLTRTDISSSNKAPNTPVNLSNKPELIIVGTALKYAQNTPNTDKKVKKSDSRISLVSKVEDLDLSKSMLRSGYKNIEKISKNQYQYNDLNQPRKSRYSSEFSFHEGVRKKDINKHLNNKTVLVFIVNRDQKDIRFKSKGYESDSEKREEEMLRREQLERKVLRVAYGNACLKVAVRKCYKTLTEVRKLICSMDFKCKDSFKEHFKKHSKVGCLNEFLYKRNKQSLSQRQKTNSIEIIHNKRSGSNINYFELCLPVMMSEETNTNNSSIVKNRPLYSNRTEPINILRDHYEKECKRISGEKCRRACNYAVTTTCGSSACDRDEKKAFTHTCKVECQHSFGGRPSDSDTEDDSDSDSDSDDSDSSDSD